MKSFFIRRIKGMTLIEILVVVAILALLIVLAFSTVLKNLLKGNDARKKADLNKIKIYVEEYEKDHNCYPTVESMDTCGSDSSIAIHPYLSNVPCDPLTHQPYVYEPDPNSPSCPSWFRIYTSLQNENDSKVLMQIGPEEAYNYYVSSDNAPIPESCSSSTDYGCFGYQCKKICRLDCSTFYTSLDQCLDACNGEPASQCNDDK